MNRALSLALALSLLGCAVTDTGNPPLSPPDTDRMSTMFLAGGLVTLVGAPGTLTRAEGVMRVTNLSTTDAPVDAPVDADGAFSLSVMADPGAVLRVQHVIGGSRSVPVDVSADTGAVVPSPVPCLSLVPAAELDLGAIDEPTEAVVGFDIFCAATLEITARGRRDAPTLSVTPSPSMITIPPMGSGELRLTVAPPAAGEAEEVILFDVVGAAGGTYALTVRASAP